MSRVDHRRRILNTDYILQEIIYDRTLQTVIDLIDIPDIMESADRKMYAYKRIIKESR